MKREFKHSEETRKKISISMTGKKPAKETRLKLSIWQKGVPKSEEVKRKISSTLKGHVPVNKGKVGLQIAWNKGTNGLLKAWNKGLHVSGNSGHKRSEESKKKVSGENCYRWIKDRTKLKGYNLDNEDRRSPIYTNWRKQVWLRDNFKCKIANPDCKGRIEAHHILGWVDHPELRFNINNGITLCHAHHPRKRAEEKRLSPYFQELVSVSNEII